ncbi:MAG: riboflavin synthase [Candidatus Eiseniibacteriota bacterium]
MFTGIVEHLGRVERIESRGPGKWLRIWSGVLLEDATLGESIAVSGCCLTVIERSGDGFAAEVVPETLERTTLGRLNAGDAVNLERPMRLSDRLGGHLMQGHVDGTGEVARLEHEGDSRRITIAVPAALQRYVAEKGSIAVDGVSLTVARVVPEGCEIAYIPHTLAVTLAGGYRMGTRVNLEVDVIARYLARLAERPAETGGRG